MKYYLFKNAVLLFTAVLLSACFWSCGKEDEMAPVAPAVAVTGVTLDRTSVSLLVGDSQTITATVAPKDASNKKVNWKSDKPEIATVDAGGKVTGVAVGEATITVTTQDQGKTATCKVFVSNKEINVTEVTLNKIETTVLVGGEETLVAIVLPENATNQKVTWSSDKPEIATVDAGGKVTGVAVGKATITVTTEDGAKTATCKVTVSNKEVKVTGVTLNKVSVELNVGASETLTATIAPADATNQNVTWKSSDVAVATVDANGKVTGVKAGTATITVTTEDGGKTATCQITVKANTVAVTGVTLNETSISLIPAGAGEGLVATVTPADATNKNVTWKSSNEAIATVNANGIVKGVAAGTATITVTTEDGGYTATCAVEVINIVNATGVTLNKTSTTIAVGASETLTATVTPDNATFKKVTWKSSNEAVATVDANGKVTGVAAGTATITATTAIEGSKKATCTVTVSADKASIDYGGYGPEENW